MGRCLERVLSKCLWRLRLDSGLGGIEKHRKASVVIGLFAMGQSAANARGSAGPGSSLARSSAKFSGLSTCFESQKFKLRFQIKKSMDIKPQNYSNQIILSFLKDEHEKFVSSTCESESINGNMKIVFQDRSIVYNKLIFIILNPEAKKLIPNDAESDLVII